MGRDNTRSTSARPSFKHRNSSSLKTACDLLLQTDILFIHCHFSFFVFSHMYVCVCLRVYSLPMQQAAATAVAQYPSTSSSQVHTGKPLLINRIHSSYKPITQLMRH